jgi:hypothetical protein
MNNISNIIISQGSNGKYYTYKGYNYDIHFPLVWTINHIIDPVYGGSGPQNCSKCNRYGSINGVFVHYCENCLHYVYEGSRGKIGGGDCEITEKKMWEKFDYMKGVTFEQIGDIYIDQPDYTLFIGEEKKEDEDNWEDFHSVSSCHSFNPFDSKEDFNQFFDTNEKMSLEEIEL